MRSESTGNNFGYSLRCRRALWKLSVLSDHTDKLEDKLVLKWPPFSLIHKWPNSFWNRGVVLIKKWFFLPFSCDLCRLNKTIFLVCWVFSVLWCDTKRMLRFMQSWPHICSAEWWFDLHWILLSHCPGHTFMPVWEMSSYVVHSTYL